MTVALEAVESGAATGSRSFHTLFGPHNGCLFATLFVGYIPPGAAKLHYHLYDEIVLVVDGEGRLHLGGDETPLGPAPRSGCGRRSGTSSRTRAPAASSSCSASSPAGSPSAAYLDR